MGAQKKCNLIVNTVIFSVFSIIYIYILIINIYETYTLKSRAKERTSSWLFLIFSLLFLSIPFIVIIFGFKYNQKFILIYKKKNSEINRIENGTNSINDEEEFFIKRTEYKFKNTLIRKRYSNRKEFYKKIVSCVTILNDGKIIFGFEEGTILVCTLDEIKCELKQNFSFNKYKLKRIIYICESMETEGEIMVSVADEFLPIKLIRLNLAYKYSLIKELARDKPYIIYQEMNKINNNDNNDIRNYNEVDHVFKILSFKKNKFLLCNKKGILLKEKVNEHNNDEYINTRNYICNHESNEIIHDIIKINEESFATLENNGEQPNIYFYKLNNLTKENKYIENVILAENKSNRLYFINESLISIADNNSILLINTNLKEKIKTILIENLIGGIGVEYFYDGGIIVLQKKSFNIFNRLDVPYIVKIKKQKGNIEDYNSLSFTSTIQDYKDEKRKLKFCNSQIKFIKCLKNSGIVLIGNDEGKLFIWEEIDKNKNHNNSINTINL